MICIIAAVAANGAIGYRNRLLFNIREDMTRFRELTWGHTVVMGRKTLESLPGGRGLPNRRSLVLTRRDNFTPDRAEVVRSLEEAVALAGDEAFVIGGQEVYAQLLPYCTRVYVTKVFADAPADAFFPNLDQDPHWKPVSVSEVLEENGLKFQYVEYEKTEP